MIGDIGLFLVFDAIDVFPQSVFDFAFGLAYILFVASCAFYAFYEIRTIACDCFFWWLCVCVRFLSTLICLTRCSICSLLYCIYFHFQHIFPVPVLGLPMIVSFSSN